MEVAEVHWIDAFVSTSEISIKKAQKTKPIKTITVGYLLANTDEGLVLAMDHWPKSPKEFKAYTFIPWGMIEEWYIYEQAKEERSRR